MITVVIGTSRPGSNSARVARIVAEIYETLGEKPAVIDLQDLPPAAFAPASLSDDVPEVQPFLDTILKSDGLVMVVPEYNGSYPGVLKHFIDLWPYPEGFDKRPVCFVGLSAGANGALRPVEHLQQVFGYRNAFLFPPRVFLAGISKLLSPEGKFLDPALHERLRKQAEGFLAFTRAIKPLR